MFRAGRYTGAAAVTVLLLDLWDCHVPNSRTKLDGGLITNVTAGLTHDAFSRQTVVCDMQLQLPGRFCAGDEDGLGTRAGAVTAKRALAAPKIDFGIAGCTADDNAFGAGPDALVACGTTLYELRLVDRPRRTYRRRG